MHTPYVLHTSDLKEEEGIVYLPLYMTPLLWVLMQIIRHYRFHFSQCKKQPMPRLQKSNRGVVEVLVQKPNQKMKRR